MSPISARKQQNIADCREVMYNALHPIINKKTKARALDAALMERVINAANTFVVNHCEAYKAVASDEDSTFHTAMNVQIETFAKVLVTNPLTNKTDKEKQKRIVTYLKSKVEKSSQELLTKTPKYNKLLNAMKKLAKGQLFLSANQKADHAVAKKIEKERATLAKQQAVLSRLPSEPVPTQPTMPMEARVVRPPIPSMMIVEDVVHIAAQKDVLVEKDLEASPEAAVMSPVEVVTPRAATSIESVEDTEEIDTEVQGTPVTDANESAVGMGMEESLDIEESAKTEDPVLTDTADKPQIEPGHVEEPAEASESEEPTATDAANPQAHVEDEPVVEEANNAPQADVKKTSRLKKFVKAFLTPFKKIGSFFSFIFHKLFSKKTEQEKI